MFDLATLPQTIAAQPIQASASRTPSIFRPRPSPHWSLYTLSLSVYLSTLPDNYNLFLNVLLA
ncbi:hypothetical protein NQ318_008765 [Aromia moschata]|uniref:Uncharacterized protein n=1 Tax=Aromia moschata TaxID=1265417 RepID=A0AAV8ZA34_9CUCU|nr:hypothetical protein NQ318_008765 [Aromia moschata]